MLIVVRYRQYDHSSSIALPPRDAQWIGEVPETA
jgi:hypothetical protein